MMQTKTKKTKGVRFVVIVAVMVALLMIPIVGLASGRDTGVQPGLPLNVSTTEGARPKGSHMLEWGVFGIAVGEFAGLIGMGVSKSRKKKLIARREEAGVLTMPIAVRTGARTEKDSSVA